MNASVEVGQLVDRLKLVAETMDVIEDRIEGFGEVLETWSESN